MEQGTMSGELVNIVSGVGGFEEQLGPGLQSLAKSIERLGRLKKVGAQTDLMNLVELRKQLDEIRRLTHEVDGVAAMLEERLGRFHAAGSERDQVQWLLRFREAFHAGYPPVEGEFPVFQIFPVEVRVDLEHELVLVNNRTVRAVHPGAVAAAVEKEWDRLNRERFNAASFAKILLRAYDLLIAERQAKSPGRNQGAAIPLRAIHQVLALKSGVSGYSLNQFAFDIYRLRRSESMIVDGRRLEFGATRNRGGIVITLPGGQRENLGSLEVIEGSRS